MNYVILIAGLYLLFIGFYLSAKNTLSMFVFNFIPFLLGIMLFVAALHNIAPNLLKLT